jgi:hypothetical protein
VNDIFTYLVAGPAILGVLAYLTFIIVTIIRNRKPANLELSIATVAQLMHVIRRHGSGANTVVGYYDLSWDDVYAWQPQPEPFKLIVVDDRKPYAGPLGKHAHDNPTRTIVQRDWRPVIGHSRISLLTTNTTELPLYAPSYGAHFFANMPLPVRAT